METTARTPRRRPGRWTLISGVSLIAVGVLSFNAYASFSATASYNQDITSGYMSLVIDDEDSATIAYDLDASNMAPGDTAQRGMSLTFAGTIAAGTPTVSIVDNSPTILTDGTANGLTLKIDVCDQLWDETVNAGIPTYDCAGAEQVVLAATALSGIIATPDNLANLTTLGENHLLLTWAFPSAANNTFNTGSGHVADLDVTFSAPQRAGTDK